MEQAAEEEEALPDFRPGWVSPWAWGKLEAHFKAPGATYDPGWLAAHFAPPGYQAAWNEWYKAVACDRHAFLRASREEARRGGSCDRPRSPGEPDWSIAPPPSPPAAFVLLNDFVVFNQALAVASWLSGLIIFCIILAGILVGVQSYPLMDGNPTLAVLDYGVQIAFTFECVVKIFAEGAKPLTYWLGKEASWNNFDFWLVLICWLPMGGNGK